MGSSNPPLQIKMESVDDDDNFEELIGEPLDYLDALENKLAERDETFFDDEDDVKPQCPNCQMCFKTKRSLEKHVKNKRCKMTLDSLGIANREVWFCFLKKVAIISLLHESFELVAFNSSMRDRSVNWMPTAQCHLSLFSFSCREICHVLTKTLSS